MKTIFHVDVNNAFLSWSAVNHLTEGGDVDYRAIPAVVAREGENGGGIVLAKSMAAKKAGVVTGEVLWQARRKCPDLYIVPPDYRAYVRASRAMRALLDEYSPLVEPFSIDECFLDMTGTESLFGPAEAAAAAIKDRIYRELGFTVNVGVGAVKVAAKMASDWEKPNRVHTLWPSEIREKLWPMPLSFLFMAGKSVVASFERVGVRTVGDLARLSPRLVAEEYGKGALRLWRYANGEDDSPVCPVSPPPKSVSKGITFSHPLPSLAACEDVLLSVAEELGYELSEKKMNGTVVTVSWKTPSYRRFSRRRCFTEGIFYYADIFAKAAALFRESYRGGAVKYLCVTVSDLSFERRGEGNLFAADDEKEERLANTIYDLKRRYGKSALTTARSLGSGGVRLFERGAEREEGEKRFLGL
ncbi:MAG: DNA polymerase Y family protein [Bacillota bacterium]|jgi:DNA polymerase-4